MKILSPSLAVSSAVLTALALFGVAACSSNSSPSTPTSAVAAVSSPEATNQGGSPVGNQGGTQTGTMGAGQGTVGLDELEVALDVTLQDEYHAESVYQRVLDDFGATVLPFATIVDAERTHAASIATLLTKRSWAVPESQWTTGNVPTFASIQEACAAGVEAEKANVALYDGYLQKSLPTDVRKVFENNRKASLEHHLPAFERCQ